MTVMIHLISTTDAARIGWLPQFVNHYRALGVDEFHLSIHFETGTSKDCIIEATARAEQLLDDCGVPLTAVLVCPFDAMATRAHHDLVQAQVSRPDDWNVWADIDEFQVWPDDLKSLVRYASCHEQVFFRGEMIDRISEDGSLPVFDPQKPIWSQFPRKCHLTRDVAKGLTQKIACSLAPLKLNPGNHFVIDDSLLNPNANVIEISHFKWDASVVMRLQRRLLPDFRERCPWWTESKNLLEHIEKCDGAVAPPL